MLFYTMNALDKIKVEINVARRQTLGKNWDTVKFEPWSRIVPYNRLYLPVAGEGNVKLNHREYTLVPGKMLLIPAFAEVNLKCDGFLEKYWSHFKVSTLNSELDVFSFSRDCLELELTGTQMQFYGMLFEKVANAYSFQKHMASPIEYFEADSAMELLLAPFLNQIFKLMPDNSLPGLMDLLNYIENNLARKLTLKDLGRKIGLHPNYLICVFRKKMGLTPMAYLTFRRINKAMSLLISTHLNIGEISDQIGISNASVFSKMFKNYWKQSPTEFRKAFSAVPGRELLP